MHIVAVTIGFIVFVAGAFYIQQSNVETSIEISDEVSPAPTTPETPTAQPISTITPIEPTAANTPTTAATNSPTPSSQNSTSYQYPNAHIVSSSGQSLHMESTDDPGKITDWYKSLIKQQDMNVQSFVTTNSNGEVLNKLGAADGNTEVMITIRKNASATITIIEVEH